MVILYYLLHTCCIHFSDACMHKFQSSRISPYFWAMNRKLLLVASLSLWTVSVVVANTSNILLVEEDLDMATKKILQLDFDGLKNDHKSTLLDKDDLIESDRFFFNEDLESTSTVATPSTDLKVCVSLTPGQVSTRKNLVHYECQARMCQNEDDDDEDHGSANHYHKPLPQFERPIFDWKTQSQHLLLGNGSCDETKTLCRHQLDVNVGMFVKEMDSNGSMEMKISCNVGDFVQLNDPLDGRDEHNSRYHFVSGQANGLIKLFKGKALHQPCNQTKDCGENMVCNPKRTNPPPDLPDYGYCECPNESIQIVKSDSANNIHMNAYTLIIDHDYGELVCAPKRSLNESCQHDQQCSSMDSNSYCRTLFSLNGLKQIASVCDCSFAYVPVDGHCVSVYSVHHNDQNPTKILKGDVGYNGDNDPYPSAYPTVVPKGVYVWWVIKPRNDTLARMSTTDRIAWTYRFLWQRYLHQRHLTQLLIIFLLLVPFMILLISGAYLHYHRKIIGQRQYKPSRVQQQQFIGGHHVDPCSLYPNHRMDFARPIPVVPMGESIPPVDMQTKQSNIDRMKLIKNDDLDQFYQTKFQ